MICISITHKNLTAAKRECFACNDEEQIKLAGAVAKTYPEAGLVLLMTCNRSEIYMSGTDTDFVWLEQQFADTKKFPVEALKGAAMRYEGKSCLTHLCRVVCGLDSAVLGEVEIIRQVKQAYLAGIDSIEFFREFSDNICHIHLSDHDESHKCIPPFDGTFDFAALFSLLKNSGYSGDCVIELYRSGFERTEQLTDSMRRLEKLDI